MNCATTPADITFPAACASSQRRQIVVWSTMPANALFATADIIRLREYAKLSRQPTASLLMMSAIVFAAQLVIICKTMLALPQAVSADSLLSPTVILMFTTTITRLFLPAMCAMLGIICRPALVSLIRQIAWPRLDTLAVLAPTTHSLSQPSTT